MANQKIDSVEGIGAAYRAKLAQAGIHDTDELLERAATKAGRQRIAADCGISEKLVLRWANMADLFRIDGVGPQFAELLECAGVDTVKELRTRNAGNLAVTMREVNADKKLTRQVPGPGTVEKWIIQARGLAAILEH